MITNITRTQLLDIARNIANSNEYLIITGMDASGKSTFIKELFPDFLTFKFDTELADGYLTKDKSIQWVCDYFQVFDRHPMIDWCVYQSARIKDLSIIDKFIEENKKDIIRFKNYIILINDKYFSIKPHEGEWVAEKREFIRTAFKYYINKVQDIVNIYLVED